MIRDDLTRMVVLDDDPTGIQTVHSCRLLTFWDVPTLREALDDPIAFFYLLTNTRAMTREQTVAVIEDAVRSVLRANQGKGYRLIFISRSDSCLRGRFPLETDVMRDVLVSNGYAVAAKTPFCPAFIEAGRLTIEGIHYMKDGECLIPVSETEFAHDNVFAYHTSALSDYICEKGANPDDYIIVNGQSYEELSQWWSDYEKTEQLGTADTDHHENQALSAVVIRSSSSLPKVIAHVPDIPLLDKTILVRSTQTSAPSSPPLFIIGSHVKKTTMQLEKLLAAEGTCGLEIDVQRILDEPALLMSETLDLIRQVVEMGLAPVVYTSRQEIRLDDADKRQHLGRQVSDFLVDIVYRLPFTPSYLVGKGGITSHDILTKGLGIRTARVMGQIVSSVPCVMARDFPYIIFPGNVGTEDSLREVYEKLRATVE